MTAVAESEGGSFCEDGPIIEGIMESICTFPMTSRKKSSSTSEALMRLREARRSMRRSNRSESAPQEPDDSSIRSIIVMGLLLGVDSSSVDGFGVPPPLGLSPPSFDPTPLSSFTRFCVELM